MNPHLFVYGSLMSTAAHPMGERLRREARLVGEGSMAGRLYKISWYPGLAEGGEGDARVHGEVYALNSPRSTLRSLDAYEGIASGRLDQDAYERVERVAILASGSTITAWVYLYRKGTAGLRPIPSGRWIAGAH